MATRASYDVAIVGAGASGLRAAQILNAAGLSAVIVEARARVGGRIHTLSDPLFPLPVELGAEFIHSRDGPVWPALEAAGGCAYLVDGDHFHFKNGKLGKDNKFWDEVGQVLDRLKRVRGQDVSFKEFVEKYARGPKFGRAREMAMSFIEGFDAAPADRISAKSIARAEAGAEETEGSESFRIIQGYGSIVDVLARFAQPKNATLLLRTIVRTIRWKRGSVELDVDSRQSTSARVIRARRVIVTLPIGVLRAGTVRFEPEIPKYRAAWEQIDMGPVVKVIARFREPFWETRKLPSAARDAKFDELCFMLSRQTAFPTWWTYHPIRGSVLTGWAGGPAAVKLSSLSRGQILDSALVSLSAMTGVGRRVLDGLLQRAHVANWQVDPFARGAYSYILVGGTNAPKQLSQPVEQTLFFAGEGTSTEGLGGTVDAALNSGKRAAEQVLNAGK